MKKLLVCFLCAAILLTAAACTQNDRQSSASQGGSSQQPSEDEAIEPEEEEDDPANATEPEEILTVPGAAMYRGEVKKLEWEEGKGTTLLLEQVEGTEFGKGEMTILLDGNTRLSFDAEDLGEGRYLEVYYGIPLGGDVPDEAAAIAANLLPDADMSVHNGFIVEMSGPDDEGQGTILLADQNGENHILFHYYATTQKYLDFESLQEGSHLNIYTDGITTRSEPPQANALEIRPYK